MRFSSACVSSACANANACANDALAVLSKLCLQTTRLLAKLVPDYSRARSLHAYRRLDSGRTRSPRQEFRKINLRGLPIGGCPKGAAHLSKHERPGDHAGNRMPAPVRRARTTAGAEFTEKA